MAWLIVLAVIIVVTALLFCRLKFIISYEDDFKFKIKYLFFSVRMNEQKPGKPKKVKKTGKEQKAPEKPAKKTDVKALLRSIEKYSDIIKDIISSAHSRLRIDSLFLKLIIMEEDAAKTAILYGEACALIYSAASLIGSLIRVKQYDIAIKPLFNGGQAEFQCECVISIRLGSAITLAFRQFAALIILSVKQSKQNKSKMAKDGVQNG